MTVPIDPIDKTNSPDIEELSTEKLNVKKSSQGVTLVPQPSDDPQDPLNWSPFKKAAIAALWSLGAFAGTTSGLGNTLGYFVQAKVYNKAPIDLSYPVVATTATIGFGPLIFVPLSHKYGRSCIFFWSMVGLLVTGIWSACMTKSNQYGPFVAARALGGLFGGNFVTLGSGVLVDIYFLHQRGKAFTALNLSFIMGTVIGPIFSGFIVQSAPWSVQFWWTNGLEAVILILAFFFLEDTYYDRSALNTNSHRTPKNFLASRMGTFFCGSRTIPFVSFATIARLFIDQFIIGVCPVIIFVGGFTLVNFGWAAFTNVILTIFLQSPLEVGGYAFTPLRNAAFLFSLFFGTFAALIYGTLVSDRIALSICRRRGGIWVPEYRLHALWLPGLILPVGLGLFGACLQHHFHYMVLAVASFLIAWATTAIIPVTVNYSIECFKEHAEGTTAVMGLYRLAFNTPIPFFVTAWMARVGVAWCLGMAAFFSIFAFMFIMLLMWKGHVVRGWSFARVASSEEGTRLMEKSSLEVE